MMKYLRQPCAKKDAQEQYDPTSLKYVLIRFGYIAVIIVAISFV